MSSASGLSRGVRYSSVEVPQKYGIMRIPTMNVYQGGEVVQQIMGAKPKAALLRDLAEFL